MVAVQGPQVAGKARTLRDMIISLAISTYEVLCVASYNVAVDTEALAVWNALSPEERKVSKYLRLETDGAERAQRLAQVEYANYAAEERPEKGWQIFPIWYLLMKAEESGQMR